MMKYNNLDSTADKGNNSAKMKVNCSDPSSIVIKFGFFYMVFGLFKHWKSQYG